MSILFIFNTLLVIYGFVNQIRLWHTYVKIVINYVLLLFRYDHNFKPEFINSSNSSDRDRSYFTIFTHTLSSRNYRKYSNRYWNYCVGYMDRANGNTHDKTYLECFPTCSFFRLQRKIKTCVPKRRIKKFSK